MRLMIIHRISRVLLVIRMLIFRRKLASAIVIVKRNENIVLLMITILLRNILLQTFIFKRKIHRIMDLLLQKSQKSNK